MGEKKGNEGGGERRKRLPANPTILKNCEFNPFVSLSYLLLYCSFLHLCGACFKEDKVKFTCLVIDSAC